MPDVQWWVVRNASCRSAFVCTVLLTGSTSSTSVSLMLALALILLVACV